MQKALIGAQLFDGRTLKHGVLVIEDGQIVSLTDTTPDNAEFVRFDSGILMPGMIDLQVNGGGGMMMSGVTSAADIAQLCTTHMRQGTLGLFPTLITDTPGTTNHVINTAISAISTPGFLGLHLEGPHLDPRRKGAHDASLIRPMTEEDLNGLCDAAQKLPALIVTVAPEAVSLDQIRRLSGAGVIVSLGHSDCTYEMAQAAIEAGARMVTHLFNAMSQIAGREPGLAGAALTSGIGAGLIADGIHVHPKVMELALSSKPDGIFLVSDAMAPAGTTITSFTLGGRQIFRKNGRLTLDDGTLAGADLTLSRAIKVLVENAGQPLARALAMATRIPAELIGRSDLGRLAPGLPADFVHLSKNLELQSVWRGGVRMV